jgi:hypothetical protein
MPYITYKPNSDIIEESQQLKLCIDLLELGYTVYVEEDALIPQACKNLLTEKYQNFSFIKIGTLDHSIKVLPITI